MISLVFVFLLTVSLSAPGKPAGTGISRRRRIDCSNAEVVGAALASPKRFLLGAGRDADDGVGTQEAPGRGEI